MWEVRDDYQEWIARPDRAHSPEVDFGVMWRLDTPATPWAYLDHAQGTIKAKMFAASYNRRWRVSWIETTGELYAAMLGLSVHNYMIVIDTFDDREAVEQRMEHWAANGTPRVLLSFFGVEVRRAYAGRDQAEESEVQG